MVRVCGSNISFTSLSLVVKVWGMPSPEQSNLSFRHHSDGHFFAWCFILNENTLFWLTISYQKLFVFSVSEFCSQMFTLKLNLRPKIGLTNVISIVKWIFVSENSFTFLCWIWITFTHVSNVCTKANRILGFLRSTCNLFSCPKDVKEMSYKGLVRPILEYASPVWDPDAIVDQEELEKVQNCAARLVTGNYNFETGSMTSTYMW